VIECLQVGCSVVTNLYFEGMVIENSWGQGRKKDLCPENYKDGEEK
jgi:hypothetical protein